MTKRIDLYFHCKTCMTGKLTVGWTTEGLQVYCEDCENNVIDIDFDGQKVKQYQPENEKSDDTSREA